MGNSLVGGHEIAQCNYLVWTGHFWKGVLLYDIVGSLSPVLFCNSHGVLEVSRSVIKCASSAGVRGVAAVDMVVVRAMAWNGRARRIQCIAWRALYGQLVTCSFGDLYALDDRLDLAI